MRAWSPTSFHSYIFMPWCLIKNKETRIFKLSLIMAVLRKGKKYRVSRNESAFRNYWGTSIPLLFLLTHAFLFAVFEVYGSGVTLRFFHSLITDAFLESKPPFPMFQVLVAIRRTRRCLSSLFRTAVVIITAHGYPLLIGTLVYIMFVLIITWLHTCVTHIFLNTTRYI